VYYTSHMQSGAQELLNSCACILLTTCQSTMEHLLPLSDAAFGLVQSTLQLLHVELGLSQAYLIRRQPACVK
jgi:hypothetical protein